MLSRPGVEPVLQSRQLSTGSWRVSSRRARTVVGAAFGSDIVNEQTAPLQAHVVETLGLSHLAQGRLSKASGSRCSHRDLVVCVSSFLTDTEVIMTAPVTIVRRFYDALGRGDVPAVLSLLDAQVEWTEAERFPYYSGTWQSPQAVLDNVLKPLAADWARFSAKSAGVYRRG